MSNACGTLCRLMNVCMYRSETLFIRGLYNEVYNQDVTDEAAVSCAWALVLVKASRFSLLVSQTAPF